MKKQAFQEDALLRATIREILYNEQPKIMNEGILSGIGDFLLGIINSVLKLFGVEIKKGETQAYTQIGQAVDGSVVDAGLVDEKGKPITSYRQLSRKNPEHMAVIKEASAKALSDALSDVDTKLVAMEDVEPVLKEPTGEDDESAKETFEGQEAKMKAGANALGRLRGVTKFLGEFSPDFKELYDQVAANEPRAPADVFYQAGILANAISDLDFVKDLKTEGIKDDPYSFIAEAFDELLLREETPAPDQNPNQPAEDKEPTETPVPEEGNVATLATKVIGVAKAYLGGHPDTKDFANLGSPGKLPSTSLEGEVGRASQVAGEGGEGGFDEKVDTLMKGVKDELGGGKVVKLTPPGSTDVINLTGLIWPPDDPAEGVNIEGEWAEGSNAGKPITDPLSSEEVAKFTEADFEISDA